MYSSFRTIRQESEAQRELELAAARVLLRTLRRLVERARRRRLKSALVASRALLRVCAHNYVCVQADRAADVLVAFMGQMTGSRSLSHIVANFRKKVRIGRERRSRARDKA